jgi:shikimate kinase
MGAGKSTVGPLLAQRLGWNFIDLDEEIERSEGRSVAEIFHDKGEPYFRELERLRLQDISAFSNSVIALGGGAFIDPRNRDLAEETGLTVWLKVSFSKVVHRVRIDGTRPKFADTHQAEQLYRMREPVYGLAKIHVSTEDGPPETTVDQIIEVVRSL